MTTTFGPVEPGPGGLAERALHAAHAHRTADPDGFARRHDNPDQWNRWARRARVARTIATALHVPVTAVLITDDPHRTYTTRTGPVPGDLITVTDPATGYGWRFIPDPATPGAAWLLLTRCPDCTTEVPSSRIATLADLGDHLDPNTSTSLVDEGRGEPGHQPGCTRALTPPRTRHTSIPATATKPERRQENLHRQG